MLEGFINTQAELWVLRATGKCGKGFKPIKAGLFEGRIGTQVVGFGEVKADAVRVGAMTNSGFTASKGAQFFGPASLFMVVGIRGSFLGWVTGNIAKGFTALEAGRWGGWLGSRA